VSAKDIQICIGIDVDAVAGWLGSYGGQDSPNDIQRGMFAGELRGWLSVHSIAERDWTSTDQAAARSAAASVAAVFDEGEI
jgi:hypothetical protein